MGHARDETLEVGSVFGEIPVIPGVWADADTLETCREELQEVVEDWLMLTFADHDPLPIIDGIERTIDMAS